MNDNIKRLEKWLNEFVEVIPDEFEKYQDNNIVIAACERYSERLIEEMILISNVILKQKGIVQREKCFTILSDLGVLQEKLSLKLESIKGMRNIMVHQYDNFDERVFYESLKELIKDTEKFLAQLKSWTDL
ncbi:MAG: type VII toxin-antitoxin system HepT family RNase toxin [Candidatus Nanoarchaeia archaeon]